MYSPSNALTGFLLSGLGLPAILLSANLTGCAANGPRYQEVAGGMAALAPGHARLGFLRPRDHNDGSSGGRAVIHVKGEEAGGLSFGGFFYTEVVAGSVLARASGHYEVFGACEVQLRADAGETVYLDVGPRSSYMIASLLGSALGGAAGAAVVPEAVIAPGEQVIASSSSAAIEAGSVAGGAAAQAIEGQGRRCNGPYLLVQVSEEVALERLQGLAWSK